MRDAFETEGGDYDILVLEGGEEGGGGVVGG